MLDKKFLLAVVLSAIVMMVYPLFLAKVSPPPPIEELKHVGQITQERVISKETFNQTPSSPVFPDNIKKMPKEPIALYTENDAIIENNRYEVILNAQGGSVKKLKIKDGKRLSIDLIDKAVLNAGIFAIEGFDDLAGLSQKEFKLHNNKAIYYTENKLVIEKVIQFRDDSYAFDISLRITNQSENTRLLNFNITTASNISDKEIYETRYVQADALFNNGKLQKIANSSLKKKILNENTDIEWLLLRNKYYSIIAKPLFPHNGVFADRINDKLAAGFKVENNNIAPGETRTYNFIFYAGPTEDAELKKVDESFAKALNFGIFTSISLVLLGVLKFFYSIFHNYGVAILLLTGCVSFLLFPLSLKSLKSMRKMQEVQPHVEKLRTEHKDNPQKLNKEIMELYRKYNVNPMGGCLPMLLQMPLFLALYQTLMKSVELKGATFLWIKDLSMPDAAFTLPTKLPLLGNAINILPILMIGAMIIQQKMSQSRSGSSAQTDQQKMMMTIMPVMFGVIFYSLPSGLVLYWLTNTLLTSTLQFFSLRNA